MAALLWVTPCAWGSPLPDASSPSEAGTARATPPAARFRLVVDAPEPVRAFLLTHLDLQRFSTLADLDQPELERLVALLPANAFNLLAALGYMAPEISARLEEPPVTDNLSTGATGTAAAPELPTVVVTVKPGSPTVVTSVALSLTGDIATREEAADQRASVQQAFALRPGQSFTQAGWDAAKNRALRVLTAQRYPAGRIDSSLADIDPVTHSAALTLVLDSGPALRLGDIEVSGTERYDPEMVRRLVRQAGLTPGSDYSLARVLEAQRRVADSGYFESVFVLVEPGDRPEYASIQVKLREMALQKLLIGVGGSTDSGGRLSLEHTHHRVPGLRWRAVSALTLSGNHRSAQSILTGPVDDDGWRWNVSGLYNQQEDASGNTRSQRLRAGQSQDSTTFSRGLFAQYDRARNYVLGQPAQGQAALSGNFAWALQRLDNLLFPESGHSLGLEAGAGVTLEQARQPYLRGRLRGLVYLPMALENPSRLLLRTELGAVWARVDVPVPSTELFLAGGDNSVRGYAQRSIGVTQASGALEPGRLQAVGSVEWQRPLLLNQQRSAWETTVFIDAGAVSDNLSRLRAKVGIGSGVRYRSPVGPLQLDLAYGLATRRLRLHMTLGFKF